jgi:hypothetical protein
METESGMQTQAASSAQRDENSCVVERKSEGTTNIRGRMRLELCKANPIPACRLPSDKFQRSEKTQVLFRKPAEKLMPEQRPMN